MSSIRDPLSAGLSLPGIHFMAQSTLLRACIDAARKWDRWQLTRILAPANQSAHAWLPAKMGALCLPTAAVATASATPYSSAVCCPWEAISDLPYQANAHTMPLRVTKEKTFLLPLLLFELLPRTPAEWMVGWLVGWPVGLSADWLAAWLIGWLAG